MKNSLRFLPSIHWLLGITFFIRLSFFGIALLQTNDRTVFHAKDTATYLVPAQQLITTGNFAANNLPEVIRTPGYSIFLTIGVLANNVEFVTILLQIVLSVFSCYLIFLLSKLMMNDVSAKFAALFFSVEPLSITYSCYLLSETLFTFLLLLAFYQLAVFLKNHNYLNMFLSAATIASAVYVRPVAYYLIFFWGLFIFLKGKNYFIRGTAFLLISFSLLGFWQVRNIRVADYAGFSAVSDVMLYFYHASSVEAQQQGLPLRQVTENKGYYDVKTYYQVHPEQQGWTEAQRYKFWRQEGISTIRKAPILFAGIYAKGLGVTLLDPGASDFLKLLSFYPKSGSLSSNIKSSGIIKFIFENKLLVVVSILFLTYLICIYGFSLRGIIDLLRQDNSSSKLLLLTCCYFFLLSGGVVAIARLRAPIMPYLLIAAGHGIFLFINKIKIMNISQD
jgi:4-amino-4-deoxy-L-arabinose transferase-like glycosyltransferase